MPTEAEWEKAARWDGQQSRVYPWGNSFENGRLNFCESACGLPHGDVSADDGHKRTAPVQSFAGGATVWGVFDMAGNVWEWTADWYSNDYYANSPANNPQGPASGTRRSVRGGSWYNISFTTTTFYRTAIAPGNYQDEIGFRCAQSE